MGYYCSFKTIPPESGFLKWYGVALPSNQTLASFEMSGEETLEFISKQQEEELQRQKQNGMQNSHDNSNSDNNNNNSNNDTNSNSTSSNTIAQQPSDLIVLKLRYNDETKKFKFRKTDTIRKLALGACSNFKIPHTNVRLVFDGESLSLDETPLSLDLEDDYLIDVELN